MFQMVFLLMLISSVKSDNEVMKSFSYRFGLKMIECGEKNNYTSDMNQDILNFWENSNSLTHEETGCLVLCAMVQLELLNQEGDLLEGNAQGFIQAQGADASMVKLIIDVYNTCRNETLTISSGCRAALELAKCFRRAIGEHNMIPDISSLLHD